MVGSAVSLDSITAKCGFHSPHFSQLQDCKEERRTSRKHLEGQEDDLEEKKRFYMRCDWRFLVCTSA